MKFLIALIITVTTQVLSASESPLSTFERVRSNYGYNQKNHIFCAEYPTGEVVNSHAQTRKVFPASVTKIYLTLFAYKKLGPRFRFETTIYWDNQTETLHIDGGHNPYLVSENIFELISLLNRKKINSAKNITLSNFTFNWSQDKETVSKLLKEHLNTHSWSNTTKKSFDETLEMIKREELPIELSNLDFKVSKISWSDSPSTTPLMTFFSPELVRQLKDANAYSNNPYAMALFEYLGGASAMETFLKDEFNASREQVYIENGAGFKGNYTTCELTLKIFKELKIFSLEHNIHLSEVMSVAGVDEGTLAGRFSEEKYKRSIVAKTGTINGISNLAGYLFDKRGEILFAIFNEGYNSDRMRLFQNDLVKALIDPLPFEYSENYNGPLKGGFWK